VAENLFLLIEKFGGYGFNKSHSAAYAMIAYQTAYLKVHYPVQFMSALLTQDMGNQDKTIKNIAECRSMGIEILPPDINESQADFAVVEGRIRFGLAAVKNVGLKAVETTIEERKTRGPFQGLPDFCRRVDGAKVNRRVIEGLIECGAFDFTGIARARLLASLDDVLRLCGANQDPNQLNMFGALGIEEQSSAGFADLPEVEEWDEKERLRREKEALGFYITGHPLAGYSTEIERFASCPIQDLPGQNDKTQVKLAGVIEGLKIKRTKKGDKMATASLEDLTGSTAVIIFPDLFQRSAHMLKDDAPLLVTGNVEANESSAKIIAQELAALTEIRQHSLRAIELHLEEKNITPDLLADLKEILFKYPGTCRVRFKIAAAAGRAWIVSVHQRFSVLPCPELIYEIERLTGGTVREIRATDEDQPAET
jgi:DNA polymerase-3 subunit alpha